MKKVFILAGELSGDQLAGWYLDHLKKQGQDVIAYGVGGDNLASHGAVLVERYENLNVTGIIEIIKHLPRLYRLLTILCTYITQKEFDEVIVVDFPGFNLQLIKRLKWQNPNIVITYLSPPQLWCWGQWRLRSLKRYCNKVIVLYPFEVTWYKERDVNATWIGNPHVERVLPHCSTTDIKENKIALIPGSRPGEIEKLLPLLLKTVSIVQKEHPDTRFILPLAQSISEQFFHSCVKKHHLEATLPFIDIITDDDKKWTTLGSCCAALSKPGTVTLELALLQVPTIVFYKTSWLTYFLAKMVAHVSQMALPNLLLQKTIFKEFVQYNVTPQAMGKELSLLLTSWQTQSDSYKKQIAACKEITTLLSNTPKK